MNKILRVILHIVLAALLVIWMAMSNFLSEPSWAYYSIVPALLGIATYYLYRANHEPKEAMRYTIIVGAALTFAITAWWIVGWSLNKRIEALMAQSPDIAISQFGQPTSVITVILAGILFILVPLIIHYISRKKATS